VGGKLGVEELVLMMARTVVNWGGEGWYGW